MLFKVNMRCNVCDWNCTVYTTDTDRALDQAAAHEALGHPSTYTVEAMEETVQ